MAVYVFNCPSCGKVIEKEMKMSERKKYVKCDCGVKAPIQISLNNFHLKGDGWYATDYKEKK